MEIVEHVKLNTTLFFSLCVYSWFSLWNFLCCIFFLLVQPNKNCHSYSVHSTLLILCWKLISIQNCRDITIIIIIIKIQYALQYGRSKQNPFVGMRQLQNWTIKFFFMLQLIILITKLLLQFAIMQCYDLVL